MRSNEARGVMVNGWLVKREVVSRRHANETEATRHITNVVLAKTRTHYHRRELLQEVSAPIFAK